MTHVECAKMMRRIDNEVHGRYNAIGEDLMRQYWEGMTHVVYHIHMPSLDNEDYFESMQYYLISEFLADRVPCWDKFYVLGPYHRIVPTNWNTHLWDFKNKKWKN